VTVDVATRTDIVTLPLNCDPPPGIRASASPQSPALPERKIARTLEMLVQAQAGSVNSQ
jgi:hypothetical protein